MDSYSDNCHSEVSSEEMSRKWVIGLEKAKATLDVTTQMNVMLSIFPLTNKYRNDLLSQKLRMLSSWLQTTLNTRILKDYTY